MVHICAISCKAFNAISGTNSLIVNALLATENIIKKITILPHFKIDLALVTDFNSDQTTPFITSQLCVETAGCGVNHSEAHEVNTQTVFIFKSVGTYKDKVYT
jgi:hypothetical protein